MKFAKKEHMKKERLSAYRVDQFGLKKEERVDFSSFYKPEDANDSMLEVGGSNPGERRRRGRQTGPVRTGGVRAAQEQNHDHHLQRHRQRALEIGEVFPGFRQRGRQADHAGSGDIQGQSAQRDAEDRARALLGAAALLLAGGPGHAEPLEAARARQQGLLDLRLRGRCGLLGLVHLRDRLVRGRALPREAVPGPADGLDGQLESHHFSPSTLQSVGHRAEAAVGSSDPG